MLSGYSQTAKKKNLEYSQKTIHFQRRANAGGNECVVFSKSFSIFCCIDRTARNDQKEKLKPKNSQCPSTIEYEHTATMAALVGQYLNSTAYQRKL